MYKIVISEKLSKELRKLVKKDNVMYSAIIKKSEEIRIHPDRYKNLNSPMNNLKRVQIGTHFILQFSVDDKTKTVTLEYLEHHDDAY